MPPTPRPLSATADAAPRPPASLTERQLSTALTWAARGFPVLPCSRTDKAALVPGFGRDAEPSSLARFTDSTQIRTWWTGRYARAHVGLLTGRSAVDGRGLVVIDCDMPKPGAEPLSCRWEGCHGGTDVLERLAAEHGAAWPETYSVITPSGGLHLYFRQPDDGPLIGCATGAGSDPENPRAPHLGPLVDVRGIGGYVIAAGSFSKAQGSPYERVSVPELLPQPLPAWLLPLLRPATPAPRPAPERRTVPADGTRAERAARAALESAAAKVAGTREGHRNGMLYGSARWLGELHHTCPHVLEESAVRDRLLAAALECGQSERESLKTISSGWACGVRTGTGAGAR